MNKFEKCFLRNELKIYGIFFEIMVLLMILAYNHRGYLAWGGETFVMLLPVAYSVYIRSKR